MVAVVEDGYRWVEHTAELELEIDGGTEEAVFGEALRAFAELVGDGQPGARASTFRQIVLAGPDRAVLLAQWLDELEFLAETEDLVPEAVDRIELRNGAVQASVRFHRGRPRPVVKGVTYHRLEFAPRRAGYRATVILDV